VEPLCRSGGQSDTSNKKVICILAERRATFVTVSNRTLDGLATACWLCNAADGARSGDLIPVSRQHT
jgi:hypothetical protein